MPRQHIDTLLWRVYREAEELLRDLERVVESDCADRMGLANKFLAIVTDHIEPLRRVVEDVEFHEKADAAIAELVASKMGTL